MFRQKLLFSLLMIAAIGSSAPRGHAESARNGISIGSLTEVVNRDGVGDRLIGYGVVSGLQGTGDDVSKSPTLARSYVTLLQNLDVPGLNEMAISKTKSFALVLVTADVPHVAGRGDLVDLSVSSAFDAESLAGGRLEYAILMPPDPGLRNDDAPVIVTAVGASIPLTLPNPVRVTLQDAGRVEVIPPLRQQDIFRLHPANGAVCFEMRVLEPWASSGIAAREIANAINEDFDLQDDVAPLATLSEGGRVLVRFPAGVDDVDKRIRFLGTIEQTRLDERLVTANTNTVYLDRSHGLVVVGSDVRFRPTVVSVEGLEHVTIQPTPEPTQFDPIFSTDSSIGLSTEGTTPAGARLQELVAQMRKLQVPVDKQIDVIIALRRSGSLINVDIWKLEE
ncbi:MAG: flagellar basal body P-ring protein FlgI [Phycisphaerales bacterium]|nr:flagellar basal body P-ring protein FlgI [Phycisphaerales bacterium]